MRKLFLLLAVSIFPLFVSAQVSQETYQMKRTEKKVLQEKLKDKKAKKAFESKRDSLINVGDSLEKVELPKNPDAYCDSLRKEATKMELAISEKEDSIKAVKQNDSDFSQVQTLNDANKGTRDSILVKVLTPSINFPLCFRFSKANIEMTKSAKLGEVFKGNVEFNEEYARYKDLLENYENYNNEIISIFRNAIEEIPIADKSEEAKLEQTALAELDKKDPMTEFKEKIDIKFYRSSYGQKVLVKQEKGDKVESIPYLDDAIYEFRIRTNVTARFLEELIDKLTPR